MIPYDETVVVMTRELKLVTLVKKRCN